MRVYAWAALAAAEVAGLATAHAQNLPPIARLSVAPIEPIVGEVVSLDASGSLDPDDGPSPLSFEWALDDGTTVTGPVITHVFTEARAHRVRVTVSDGERSTEASATVPVLAPPSAPGAWSGPIAVSGEDVVVADAIGERVVVLDAATLRVRWTTPVPEPRGLAVSTRGEVWVACGDGALRRLSLSTGALELEVTRGTSLDGVIVAPDGHVLATDPHGGRLLELVDGALVASYALAPDGRAVAIDALGARAYVAHFLSRAPTTSGRVSVIVRATGAVDAIDVALDPSPDTASSGGGVPNLLGALALAPSGTTLWLGGTKSNTSRGVFLDGRELTPENRVRGLLAPIELSPRADRVDARIDTNDAGQVSAIAFSPRGRFLYAADPGIGAVSIYDLAVAALFEGREPGSTVPYVARVEVGDAPDGLAVSADGARLYVRLRESLEVVVVGVADASSAAVEERVSLGADPRPAAVALGARMFHSSRPPVHSRGGYVACATCHPGGAMDGRTWDFTQSGEGLRNTIDLRGRQGLDHGPLHWSANFDEVQDFEYDIVHAFGGTGLAGDGEGPRPPLGAAPNAGRSAELDALAAYVATLGPIPRSPHRAREGTLTPAGARGQRIFFDEAVGCAQCHAPPRFTDSRSGVLHDVGTLRPSSGRRVGEALPGLDTPTLRGLWASAPYLHDGRAPDLRAVLTTENTGDRHGRTAHLTGAELDDLVAYLEELDASESSAPPSRGCAAASGGVPSSGGLVGIAGLLVVAARARRRRTARRG